MIPEPTSPVASVCDDVVIPTQIDSDLFYIIEHVLRRDVKTIALFFRSKLKDQSLPSYYHVIC